METITKDSKRVVNSFGDSQRLLRHMDDTDGYINSTCLAPSDAMVTPLLNTINSLTSSSWSDSSDECDVSVSHGHSHGHSHTKSATHQYHCSRGQSKSVRFNSAVKFSSVPTPTPNSKDTSVPTKAKPEISANYVSNKSILKDPLCETLRSAIKAGEFTTSCSLEGEIDELLYGRLNPMVTSRPPKLSPYGVCGTPTLSPSPAHNSHIYGAGNGRKSNKGQLSEMAKCMLDMFDDYHPVPASQTTLTPDKSRLSPTYRSLSSVRRQTSNSLPTTRDDDTESIDILMKELSNGQSDTSDLSDISSISYRTLPEQHIYEEILYDCLESEQKDRKHCSKCAKH